jgi:protein TonB
MRVASFQPWSGPYRTPALRRTAILAVVAALHFLLLIMLLRLAPAPPLLAPSVPITVELLPEAPLAPKRTRAAKARRAQKNEADPSTAPPAQTSSAIWSQVIPITREQFAVADIKMAPRPMAQAGDGASQSSQDGNDTAGAGEGPNGEPLYNAQWYRRPTSAELGFYLPPGTPPTGWGMIACQTVPDYRVENCHELAQSPAGSGLARAVRQAAWQFRVLPPRIGGRPMVGAWVRIRIDYSVGGPA